jgi:hypothetical protein
VPVGSLEDGGERWPFPVVFGLATFGDVTDDVNDRPLPHAQAIGNVVEQGVLAEQVGVDFVTDSIHLPLAPFEYRVRPTMSNIELYGTRVIPVFAACRPAQLETSRQLVIKRSWSPCPPSP